MSNLLISVVIPTYNRANRIEETIDAICNQTIELSSYEVIVVNNNSKDNTEEVLKKLSEKYNNLSYVFQSRQGASPTRNKGVSRAKADIVLLLDDDMIAEKDLLEQHLKSHENHSGSVLGFFENDWGDNEKKFLQYLKLSGEQNAFPFENGEIVSYQHFYTGCISVKKDLFMKVGGFDEGFVQYGVEDIDLGYRMEFYGNKILYNKNAKTFHKYSPSFKSFKKKKLSAGKSLKYFLRKYPHLRYSFFFEPFAPLSLLILKIVFSLTYPFAFIPMKRLNPFLFHYYHWNIRYAMYIGFRRG